MDKRSGCCMCCFFVKQKTAYEMHISGWSSDVCASDLQEASLGAFPSPWSGPQGRDGTASRHLIGKSNLSVTEAGPAPLIAATMCPSAAYPFPSEIGRASSRERVCPYV